MRAKGWRLPAHEIEQLVLNQLATFLRDGGKVLDALSSKQKSPDVVSAALTRAVKLADACETGTPASQVEIAAALVRRVTMARDQVTIELERMVLAARLLDQEATPTYETKGRGTVTLEVPVRFRRRGVEAKLVVQDQERHASEPDANVVKALARAHQWIVRGEADGIGAIARRERLDRAYVTRVLCLAFLAPEITKEILEGRQPLQPTAKRLINSALRIPLSWADQIAFVSWIEGQWLRR